MNLLSTTSNTSFTQPTPLGRGTIPYSISYNIPWELHPNEKKNRDSQMGILTLGFFGQLCLLHLKHVLKVQGQ